MIRVKETLMQQLSNNISEDSKHSQATLLDTALAYAKRGWPVVPLHTAVKDGCSCHKPDCANVGKHPRYHATDLQHGLKNATTDETRIRRWWLRWRHANIGIITGNLSGLVVIDIDPRHAGHLTVEDLETEHGKFPDTVESLTGGGGRHLFYQHPGGDLRISAHTLGPGVDIKADGGYVVAPPSRHASGQCYEWEASSHPDDIAIAPLPRWFPLHEPIPHDQASHGQPYTSEAGDGSPGDDFNQRATVEELRAILTRHGWMVVEYRDGVDYLRRPGKEGRSYSATLGAVAPTVFYCFSTNGDPFEAHRGYKPFSVYGLLEHGGDFKAAARALAEAGYGRQGVGHDPTRGHGQPDDGWVDGEEEASTQEATGPRQTGPQQEDDSGAWQADLSRTKNGDVRETLWNITLALQHLAPWATDCWYDVVRDLRMVGERELDDTLVTKAGLVIEERTRMPIRSKHLLPTAVTYLCHQRPRDLLREWLEALPPWDGWPRLQTWLQTYAHARKDAYGRDVSRLMPVSMVARVMDPGCQYRFVVIFEGPENTGKTKLVRALATPEWYRELSHGLEGKEAHMRIKRAWVAELAELSSLSKTEEARLKSFFTLHEDAYIPKYSNFEVVHKRRTVFVGTVNPESDNTYLRGQTGNTRYLPIEVHDIDLDGFQAIREQLFAEALHDYRQHPDDWWKLSSAGETAAQEVREERRQRSVYEDELGMWLERTKKRVTWWEELAADFLLLPRAQWADRRQQMEIAKALKALSWTKEKRQRIKDGLGSEVLVYPWRPTEDWRVEP
jgi:predicted P-loop ATPase